MANPLSLNIPSTISRLTEAVDRQNWPREMQTAFALELLLKQGEQITVGEQ